MYTITKQINNLKAACTNDPGRENLLGVHINCSRAIATNGNILAIRELGEYAKELPGNSNIVFPKTAQKSDITVDDNGICTAFPANSVKIERDVSFPCVEDLERSAEKVAIRAKIGIDAALLLKLSEALQGKQQRAIVTLEIGDTTDIIKVTVDDDKAVGYIMPCRMK